jgi:hypothetical protein
MLMMSFWCLSSVPRVGDGGLLRWPTAATDRSSAPRIDWAFLDGMNITAVADGE